VESAAASWMAMANGEDIFLRATPAEDKGQAAGMGAHVGDGVGTA
jgi:hypothetical protein